MGVNSVRKPHNLRNNDKMRPLVRALPEVRKETDDLDGLS